MRSSFFIVLRLLALLAFITACAPQAPEGYAYILVTITPSPSGEASATVATVTLDTPSVTLDDEATVPLPDGGLPTATTGNVSNGSTNNGDTTAPVNNVTTVADPNLNLPEATEGRIAFMGNYKNGQQFHVFLTNADGTGLKLVTESMTEGYYPALSPDGTKVAFVGAGETSTDIFVADVNTGETTNLTNLPGTDNFPVWSPDGSQIAFTSDRDGGDIDLWIMNADGTDAHRVARTPGADNGASWSPDGAKLVYSNKNEIGESLWIIDIASGEFTQLFNPETGVNDSSPKWGPDGKEIVFFRDDGMGAPTINTITPDGETLTQITDGTTPAVFPLYSPDGKWLMYTSIVQANGSQEQQLTLLNRAANTRTTYPNLSGFATSWAATDEVLADTGLLQGLQNSGVEIAPAIYEAAYKLGSEAAPVKIVEFADFQCTFCQGWYNNTYPQLQPYIDDGTVQLIFVDFPLTIHPQADEAAQAAHCVAEQGGAAAFWKMHDKFFESMSTWSGNNNPGPIFADLADSVGVDGAAVEACLNSGKYLPTVQAALDEGFRLGVDGTPTFFINGDRVIGAQPWEAFAKYLPSEGGE